MKIEKIHGNILEISTKIEAVGRNVTPVVRLKIENTQGNEYVFYYFDDKSKSIAKKDMGVFFKEGDEIIACVLNDDGNEFLITAIYNKRTNKIFERKWKSAKNISIFTLIFSAIISALWSVISIRNGYSLIIPFFILSSGIICFFTVKISTDEIKYSSKLLRENIDN